MSHLVVKILVAALIPVLVVVHCCGGGDDSLIVVCGAVGGVSGLRTNSHLTNPGVCWLEDGFV